MVRAVFLYRRDVMGRGMAATDIERGLSTAEVEERIAAGKINRNMGLKTKSVKELIIENLCTLFNLINVILAFLVILTGSFKNLTFLSVVALNTAIGVIQSMRSKKMVDKLTLLTSKKAVAVRDGAAAAFPLVGDFGALGERQDGPVSLGTDVRHFAACGEVHVVVGFQ